MTATGDESVTGAVLPPLVDALLREIALAENGPELTDNVDPVRHPDGVEPPTPAEATQRLIEVLAMHDGLSLLYTHLEEAGDRALLVRLLAFRVLGNRRVQLPMTLSRLEALVERAVAQRTDSNTAELGILGWHADDYDLGALGHPIRVRCHFGAIVQTFLLEQYRIGGDPDVGVRPGDIVIDGGAYWGDTALYFADLAGPEGRVMSFEFEPSNLEALRHNLDLNAELARRIAVVRRALWDVAGEEVAFRPFGPGTAVVPDGEAAARTDSIDALVARRDVDRVDFVKLDIEGSELNVLRGAEATLRRFRPRLAIAAYHKSDDLVTLPRYLLDLDVGYRFRLGHTTMHAEETVLFARAD